MKKGITAALGLLIAVAAMGWVLANNKKENDAKTAVVAQAHAEAISVRIAEAGKKTPDINFNVNGTFQAAQRISFNAENSGRITRILVDEGTRVVKGQLLATIETDLLSVDLATADDAYQNAMRDLARFESSFNTGGVTQQQLDQARLHARNAKARVRQARVRISDANIKAPFDGVVNKRYIEQGAFISAGNPLFEIVDISRLKLVLSVNEAQVSNLREGDQVRIKSSVFPDRNFMGQITFISPQADHSLNFPVEIELKNHKDRMLKAGMYGTAVFEFPEQAPVITVPRTAFVGSVSSSKIFVLGDGNLARIRNVVAGRVFGDQVEILEGLTEGERVITSGQINLTDGAMVSPLTK